MYVFFIVFFISARLSSVTTKTISVGLINSRLDYCHSLLNNTVKKELFKRQSIWSLCLAPVVVKAPGVSTSLSLLKQLHWFPFAYRIKFKPTTVTYRTASSTKLTYLVNLPHCSNMSRN